MNRNPAPPSRDRARQQKVRRGLATLYGVSPLSAAMREYLKVQRWYHRMLPVFSAHRPIFLEKTYA